MQWMHIIHGWSAGQPKSLLFGFKRVASDRFPSVFGFTTWEESQYRKGPQNSTKRFVNFPYIFMNRSEHIYRLYARNRTN